MGVIPPPKITILFNVARTVNTHVKESACCNHTPMTVGFTLTMDRASLINYDFFCSFIKTNLKYLYFCYWIRTEYIFESLTRVLRPVYLFSNLTLHEFQYLVWLHLAWHQTNWLLKVKVINCWNRIDCIYRFFIWIFDVTVVWEYDMSIHMRQQVTMSHTVAVSCDGRMKENRIV